jgi:hypothetical protein
VADEFGKFMVWLAKNRKAALKTIGKIDNGLEGWLKFEFLTWLCSVRALKPGPNDDVGLEYKVRLRRGGGMDRESKRCDIWIRHAGRGKRWHYVELKAPLANRNAIKVASSAANDYWYMSRIVKRGDANPASGSAVVVGFGFEEEDWEKLMDRFRTEAEVTNHDQVSGGHARGCRIRWCVFSHSYL